MALIVAIASGALAAVPGASAEDLRGSASRLAPVETRPPAVRELASDLVRVSDGSAIGAVGEILRRRLMQAADAGIVVFQDDGPQRRHPIGEATALPGLREVEPRRTAEPPILSVPRLDVPAAPSHGALIGTSTDVLPAGRAPAPTESVDATATPRSARQAELGPVVVDEAPCIPDKRLELPLLTGASVLPALSARWGRLLGEFDRPDDAEVVALARSYLALGLGLEASSIVGSLAPEHPDATVLLRMAAVVEGRPPAEGGTFFRPGCGGLHDAWRAFELAVTGLHAAAVEAALASSESIEVLPDHLRSLASQWLSFSALEVGDVAAASWFRTLASRGDGATSVARALSYIDGRLAFHDRRPDAAVTQLQALVANATEWGARATLDLAHLHLDGFGADAGEALALDIAAAGLLHRGTPLGREAVELEIALTEDLQGVDAAHMRAADALARGLIDASAMDQILRGTEDARERYQSLPLAILHDAAPERFASALTSGEFRQRLALSYASIGAPTTAASILRDEDRSPGFERRLEEASAPFSPVSTAIDPSQGDPLSDADHPAGRLSRPVPDPTGSVSNDGTPLGQLDRVRAALSDIGRDIEHIREVLDDG